MERSSRFLRLVHLPYGHSAEQLNAGLRPILASLPSCAWLTLTWDQGIEMAHHGRISIDTDLDIYFCDPRSPWQRGTNENTNGLLRQYFPKGTNLSIHGLEDLRAVSGPPQLSAAQDPRLANTGRGLRQHRAILTQSSLRRSLESTFLPALRRSSRRRGP